MKQDSLIDFVLVTSVDGLYFNPAKPQGIDFIPYLDKGFRIVLLPTQPDGDAFGSNMGLTCKVYKSFPATNEQILFVNSYINKSKILRLAEGISLPYISNEKTLIFHDGTFGEGYRPRRYLCPSDILSLLEIAETELSEKVDRFLKLLRWRQYCDSPGDIIKHKSLYWKVGQGDYSLAPLDGGPSQEVSFWAMFGIRWSDRYLVDFQNIWKDDNISEPLGHTLLREAAELSGKSPRSSILMMTAALETAVKTHICKIAPDTSWLIEKTPSPPIFKILKDFIPLIYRQHGKELIFWDKVKPSIVKVQKLIEIRNIIAHTGKMPEDIGSIQIYIDLVSDILYLIDVLEGHEWAKSLVGNELRKSLGWPDPIEGRIKLTVSDGY